MAYTLRIRRTARRKLQSLSARDRHQITDAIVNMGSNPDEPLLDIRRLTGSQLWRLRLGKWRVIYERNDESRMISVEKIGARGDVYK